MLNTFRRLLRRHRLLYAAWAFVLTWFGKICLFWMKPLVTLDDIEDCRHLIHNGDIICTRSRRYPVCWTIPGKYKHTATYTGHGMIIHAVSPHVCEMTLREFLAHYDGFIVLRPRPPFNWKAADRWAFINLKVDYDFAFSPNTEFNDPLYCHELGATYLEKGGVKIQQKGDCILAEDLMAVCDVVMEV